MPIIFPIAISEPDEFTMFNVNPHAKRITLVEMIKNKQNFAIYARSKFTAYPKKPLHFDCYPEPQTLTINENSNSNEWEYTYSFSEIERVVADNHGYVFACELFNQAKKVPVEIMYQFNANKITTIKRHIKDFLDFCGIRSIDDFNRYKETVLEQRQKGVQAYPTQVYRHNLKFPQVPYSPFKTLNPSLHMDSYIEMDGNRFTGQTTVHTCTVSINFKIIREKEQIDCIFRVDLKLIDLLDICGFI